jgi:UDP-N-acetyl-D-galactosamine dehydrogenase
MSKTPVISVVGLGYVGLPLAITLAKHFEVIGFDIGKVRIAELKAGRDRTNEVEPERLKASTLKLIDTADDMKGSDVFIVTVPTPVDDKNEPDLSPVMSACRTLGPLIGNGSTIVFESTVYPGVTEDLCGPALEQASGLTCGVDFWLGYSPERINPGDREHSVDRITKVIAGQTPEITELLADIYGKVTTGGVFRAVSIKAAEAAKAIENAQRDINIAFINEVTMIFNKVGLSVHDVLDASATKWNFLPFRPGLVGGHCIGVDPYYLARCALDNGHDPEIILSGRRLNDRMGAYIADSIAGRLPQGGRVLVLGLTFKENVPDLRNSKVIDVINGLKAHGLSVEVHDALANAVEARQEYDITLLPALDGASGYDAVVGAVSHDVYAGFGDEDFLRLVKPGGLVADVKGMWRKIKLPAGLERWSL